ncbi:TRAP transporter small permease [Roseibium aggregatum]|uniref:TRAP transporter small permease protein n=1 Tax=Roseibium aggregatum TaxID=187304 RepID=A0A939EC74_9HYPH|nr:TRAP transporter small permease [Roseibium aggregatum]MBN9669398.1 TRAP transporter small permease [Roseibium aggregatum]
MGSAVRKAAAGWALLGGVFVFLIMVVTSLNVGAFALDRVTGPMGVPLSGLPGYEDFVRLLVSCAALMFFPFCQSRRAHVTVELFVSALPKFVQVLLDRVWLAAMLALSLFLAYWMTLGMLETRSDNALSPVLGWAEWPFYLPGILSLLLWAAVIAGQLVSGESDA